MRLKIQYENRCPVCGRTECSERIHRSKLLRWLCPSGKLMKCRLCLTRYLVRRDELA